MAHPGAEQGGRPGGAVFARIKAENLAAHLGAAQGDMPVLVLALQQVDFGQAHAHGGLDPEAFELAAARTGDFIEFAALGEIGEGADLSMDMGHDRFIAHGRAVQKGDPAENAVFGEIEHGVAVTGRFRDIAVADHDLALFGLQHRAVQGGGLDPPARAQHILAALAAQVEIAVPRQPGTGGGMRFLSQWGVVRLRRVGLFLGLRGQDGKARIGILGLSGRCQDEQGQGQRRQADKASGERNKLRHGASLPWPLRH